MGGQSGRLRGSEAEKEARWTGKLAKGWGGQPGGLEGQPGGLGGQPWGLDSGKPASATQCPRCKKSPSRNNDRSLVLRSSVGGSGGSGSGSGGGEQEKAVWYGGGIPTGLGMGYSLISSAIH